MDRARTVDDHGSIPWYVRVHARAGLRGRALRYGADPWLGHPGWFACVALLLVLAIALGTLTSTDLQKLVLKPNRSVSEVRPFLRVLVFISGLLLVLSILTATSALKAPPNPRAVLDAGIAVLSYADGHWPGTS